MGAAWGWMMLEERAVLALTLPPEFFPDGDDICRVAGTHLARELEAFLERERHTIPDWVRGGCTEDAWVHLESDCQGTQYRFTIVYFPRGKEDWMAIQAEADRARSNGEPSIRDVLQAFGAGYKRSEVLSQAEFDAQY
jgi:hypothetical protein